MSDGTNFLAWLIEDINDVSAEIGTPRDAQLREFAEKGFLKHCDCRHGTNFYAITSRGATAYTNGDISGFDPKSPRQFQYSVNPLAGE